MQLSLLKIGLYKLKNGSSMELDFQLFVSVIEVGFDGKSVVVVLLDWYHVLPQLSFLLYSVFFLQLLQTDLILLETLGDLILKFDLHSVKRNLLV